MVDLERQVAEAKCPACHDLGIWKAHKDILHCQACQGTGLRWPGLSRDVCKCWTGTDKHEAWCQVRIPDVTLEKVLELLRPLGHGVLLGADATGWFCHSSHEYSDTPLEAACAALLASC